MMVDDFKFGLSAACATPEYVRSIFAPDTAAILTVGAVGKLASSAADHRERLAKLDSVLADISDRIAKLEKQRENGDLITSAWPAAR